MTFLLNTYQTRTRLGYSYTAISHKSLRSRPSRCEIRKHLPFDGPDEQLRVRRPNSLRSRRQHPCSQQAIGLDHANTYLAAVAAIFASTCRLIDLTGISSRPTTRVSPSHNSRRCFAGSSSLKTFTIAFVLVRTACDHIGPWQCHKHYKSIAVKVRVCVLDSEGVEFVTLILCAASS